MICVRELEYALDISLDQGSQTCSPWAACGPRRCFVQPTMFFWEFFDNLTFRSFSLFTGVEKCSTSE